MDAMRRFGSHIRNEYIERASASTFMMPLAVLNINVQWYWDEYPRGGDVLLTSNDFSSLREREYLDPKGHATNGQFLFSFVVIQVIQSREAHTLYLHDKII